MGRLLLAFLLWTSSAMGTVLRPIQFEAMQARATHISLSEVTALDSFWHSGRILTWVTLRPTTTFKGAGSTVRLLVPGGTVGELSQYVPDGPRFELGQASLYFLEPMSKFDGFRLVGFTQGKVDQTGTMPDQFRLWTDRLGHPEPGLRPQHGHQLRGKP